MTQTIIDVETLRELLEQGQPVTVLDIRRAEDRAEWAIPGSLHVAAYDALKANDPNALAGVNLPTDRPIVTICGAGMTSLLAAEQLRARGFEAFSLAGGMKAWSLAWNSAEVSLVRSEAKIVQVRRTGKGCLSYLIGSQGNAAVIDAALESEIYLNLARRYGWTITTVLDTHIHADHLSRTRRLAEQSGATLYLPDQERATYSFSPLRDGAVLNIGAARLVALPTPGHTLESTSYLLDDQALFTGDTLFLAGVGRPDLEASPEEAKMRAHLLYHSLQRLLTLPLETLVLPGHTSEPIAFDDQPVAAPLAQVRKRVELLSVPEDSFVEALLARIPPTPPNH
ncbi:MAG: MBL fold metallo-hydrolase, partial [Chloroflexi bacterium]|nr:MBL fold metallo-hydrolase [Chloroflexota bacterium]